MGRPAQFPTKSILSIVPAPKPAPNPYTMTTAQAAAYIGIDESSIRRAIYAGALPSRKTKDHGIHLIKTEDLEAWVDQLPPFTDFI